MRPGAVSLKDFGLAAVILASLSASPARAEACGPLRILNIAYMVPTLDGDAELIPVHIGGKPHFFLLDTGGYLSQISRTLAQSLNLPIRQDRHELYDAVGNVTRDQTIVPDFGLGEIQSKNVPLMVSPTLGAEATRGIDGLLAPDLLVKYDMELDFNAGKLNLFSPDHCPGHVVYWTAPAVASVPITLEQPRFTPDRRERRILREIPVEPANLGAHELDGFHIYVPVMLDGHQLKALIDTGATATALRKDIAETQFGLSMGSADTPQKGTLNGEAGLTTYSHMFKNLSFGSVSISDLRLTIIPNAMNRNIAPQPLVADRTKTERDLVSEPELILGMDVLRRMRIYFAFQEKKIYVSPSAMMPGGPQPYPPDFIAAMLKRLDTLVAANPDDAQNLNDRCFWRGIAKSELDGALADCDKSLKIAPGNSQTLDSRAFVLYQQGKYIEALEAYDSALKSDPGQAASLWMRGLTRGKLGDAAGKDADTALARKDDPNIELEFRRIGIEN